MSDFPEVNDHLVANPDNYNVTQNADGTWTIRPTWVDNPAEVLQEGTPVNAAFLAKIPEAIDAIDEKVTSQLADIETEAERAFNYYWIPEAQPPARIEEPGYFIDAINTNADGYINNYFEPIRLANPDYVTRVSMGKDQSGLYDVWQYQFTPKNYKKTIVITSGMHGSEFALIVAMIRFLDYLTNDWEKYPELACIRENVRLIYVPVLNPWGMSQTPKTRQNSSGVDLNRNFDYKWAEYPTGQPFDHDYKGTAPFSEVEARYVRTLLETYTDAVAYIDLHNTGSGSRDYFMYLPEKYNFKTYEKLVAYFTRDIAEPNVLYNINSQPTASNYILTRFGIPASHPEWCDSRFSVRKQDAGDVTKSLEWIANVIIEHAREFSKKETFIIENYYTRSSTDLLLPASRAEIPEFRFEFDAPFDGLVLVEGVAVVSSSVVDSIHYVVPTVIQFGTDFNAYTPSLQRDEYYASGASRVAVPFQTQTYIERTGGNIGKVRVGLFGNSNGNAVIYRYRCRITVIPSDSKQRYQIYTANGREGQGVGAMQIVYPTV